MKKKNITSAALELYSPRIMRKAANEFRGNLQESEKNMRT